MLMTIFANDLRSTNFFNKIRNIRLRVWKDLCNIFSKHRAVAADTHDFGPSDKFAGRPLQTVS